MSFPDFPGLPGRSGCLLGSSLLDTDHVWGVGGSPAWVWKSLLRGHNPLFMDPYDGSVLGTPGDPQWKPVRRALGHARQLAERLTLHALQPRDDLASTRYCLADPGNEYVVYLPQGGNVTIDLAAGQYEVEWIDAGTGMPSSQASITARGGDQEFQAPDKAHAILLLRHRDK